ncbi:unnamed protein product [Prorocentrum cordatum]|uniref:Uncharacterized protein n=1 Tax=Prorocentrum cordatum TaxID=2364126 RepID=A0ABN9Y813_9DINO|nr:unnamed protein product [Polarella glacialis]
MLTLGPPLVPPSTRVEVPVERVDLGQAREEAAALPWSYRMQNPEASREAPAAAVAPRGLPGQGAAPGACACPQEFHAAPPSSTATSSATGRLTPAPRASAEAAGASVDSLIPRKLIDLRADDPVAAMADTTLRKARGSGSVAAGHAESASERCAALLSAGGWRGDDGRRASREGIELEEAKVRNIAAPASVFQPRLEAVAIAVL